VTGLEQSTRCQPGFYCNCLQRATMKATIWSPMQTSKEDYQVNVYCQSQLAATDILQSTQKHCMNAQERAGALELTKYNHV
jgi:hypothetical protein